MGSTCRQADGMLLRSGDRGIRHIGRAALLAGVACMGIDMTGVAWAQVTPAVSGTNTGAAGSMTAAPTQAGGAEEITVTSERRKQNVQNVEARSA